MNNARNIKHLYARAGFGIRFEDLHDHENWSVKKTVRKLFKASENQEPITVLTENLDLRHPVTDAEKAKSKDDSYKQGVDLNNTWLKQLSETDAQLREKMTLFWHNHFACICGNVFYSQQINNIERANALGNFKTLLLQVSQTPGMLLFLTNQQNQKGHPNENFARELMELFTLGRGHYTEQDVKESARAFTGWAFSTKNAEYTFNPRVHDDGVKTFMGQSANFCGEDIIDIIVAKKQTAIFICSKLYRFFVNDVPDMGHVKQMADVFYSANYEIKPLLEYLFTADWFYDDKNIGNLIKSPIDLLVGINRQFYVSYQNPMVLIQFQRTLGQELFHPPNVAGWPGGKSWIDSSTLMYRMKIPSTILNAGVIDFTGKANPEDEAYLAFEKKQQLNVIKKVQAQPDWDKFLKEMPSDITREQMAEFMLEPSINSTTLYEVQNAPDIKTAVIQIISTPEYQLC